MAAIHWRRQLSVGQSSIDEDHKHLIDYLNQLDDALHARVFLPAKVAMTLMKLLEYTHEHFAREERIMQMVKYPKFEEHKALHVHAVRVISQLSAQFTQDPSHATAERIYNFTADWLVNHIILQDTQLTPYVRGVWL